MTAQEIKNLIGVEDYLSSKGIQPAKVTQSALWYNSPLREDKNPSFIVRKGDRIKSVWSDMATGEKGNVIDLCMRVDSVSFTDSLDLLSSVNPALSSFSLSRTFPTVQSDIEILKVYPLTHPVNIKYLESRAIPAEYARIYLKQVYHCVNDRKYWAIGWKNDRDGWELTTASNTQRIKRATAKAPTTIAGQAISSECLVFEAMFDFLSFLVYRGVKHPPKDCIILNGCSQESQIDWSKYTLVHFFGDNDNAGDELLQKISEKAPTKDHRKTYLQMNDFNDFLLSKME